MGKRQGLKPWTYPNQYSRHSYSIYTICTLPFWVVVYNPSNRLLQQKKAQVGNNLAEQQVNNNNKAKQNSEHKNNSFHHYPKF